MATAHKNWVTVEPGFQLRGDAAASYLRMRKAGLPAGGAAVMRRTFEKQAELRKRYERGAGPLAARPSWGAPHIQGIAIDNQTTSGGAYRPSSGHKWMTSGGSGGSKPKSGEKLRCHTYGWRRTVPSERWHFGYDPGRDTKASADLKARLKKLGFSTLKDFQKTNGLKADGKAGPATWTKLLTNPKKHPSVPATKPKVTNQRLFRFGSINLQDERFGGAENTTSVRGNWIKKNLNPSILALTEAPEPSRKAVMKVLGSSWKTYPVNYLCVMWDSKSWTHVGKRSITFDKKLIHGAIRVTLTERATREQLDVICVHIRPKAGFPSSWSDSRKLEGKKDDVRAALKLVRPGVRTLLAGDFNTSAARGVIEAAGKGLRLITPFVDTHDDPGDQKLDQVYGTNNVVIRNVVLADPGSVSDHKAWLVQGTITK